MLNIPNVVFIRRTLVNIFILLLIKNAGGFDSG
jgi:hypothetical protein